MADIRTTIAFLCKHINLLFCTNTKPEMFRLAKFNKSDDNVVVMFWSLLNAMIEPTQPKSDNIVQNVKRYFLYVVKYDSAHLYALPEDMSYGSRELLVAFAYLLSQNHLNKFIQKEINDSPFNPNVQFEAESNFHNIKHLSFNLNQLKTDEDYENALEWIEGQTDYNNKVALDYQNHFQKLSAKICGPTSMDSRKKSLTLLETLAVNNAEKAKDFLDKTDRVAKIVQNQEIWLKKQSLFWDWMNSVLREKKVNLRLTRSEDLEEFVNTLKK